MLPLLPTCQVFGIQGFLQAVTSAAEHFTTKVIALAKVSWEK